MFTVWLMFHGSQLNIRCIDIVSSPLKFKLTIAHISRHFCGCVAWLNSLYCITINESASRFAQIDKNYVNISNDRLLLK